MHKSHIPLAAAILLANTSAVMPVVAEQLMLEEITVTATKRATSLQDTALAISAFSQDTLTTNHVTNLFDLQGMVPNLHIQENGDHNIPLIYIRGQGTADQTEAGDQGIAFYIDGVFAARSQGATALMYDMERVEVLRGPQGTLFGRNSTAGALSLHTAKPVQEFEASAGMTAGNRSRRGYSAMVNIPVTSDWAVRFAGTSDQQDGDIDFAGGLVSSQQKYGAKDLSSYRVSSMYTPTDSISWFLSYENFTNQGTGNVPVTDGDNRVDASTTSGFVDLNSDSWRTRVDWDLNDDLTFSYIGGYTEFDQSQLWGSAASGDVRETVWSFHEATQHEIQLKNSDDNRLRWTVGAFFFEEDNGIRFDMRHSSWGNHDNNSTGNLDTLSTFIQPGRTLESTSFFGQATFDVTDRFRLTAGLRDTNDEREDKGGRSIDCTQAYIGDLPTPVAQGSDLTGQGCWVRQYNDMGGEWSKVTGMFRAEFDISDDVMLFASYGTGWKSGVLQDGQNSSATNGLIDRAGNNLLIQKPEENDAIELGIKSTWLDGAMTLNANLFFMNYDDMQVTAAVIDEATDTSVLTKTNAGGATMEGLEVDMNWKVSQGGLLIASFSYLQAEYDELYSKDATWQSRGHEFGNPCRENDGVGGCVDDIISFAGNTLPFAPEYALTVSYMHDFVLASGATVTPRLRVSYQDEMFLTQENRGDRPAGFIDINDPGEKDIDRQEAYAKVDVSVTYLSEDAKWSLEGFINNATDEQIKQGVWMSNSAYETAYQWTPSRNSGVRITYNF